MTSTFHFCSRALLATFCVVVLSWCGSSVASVYGGGSYSGCADQAGCAPVSPAPSASPTFHTVSVTPHGLEFAVNLANGQTIIAGTYDVVVTQLNGQGRTFERVEFLR